MAIGAVDGPALAAIAALAGCAAVLLVAARRLTSVRRDERGSSGDGFMKGVVKVSIIVMLVAGATVWIVDRAEENNRQSDPDSQTDRPDKPKRDKGGGRGDRN